MLEAMRVECKQMLVKAEEDLRLRPTKKETGLQMLYHQAGLSSYYNATLNSWKAMQLQAMQNPMNPYLNRHGADNHGADNNWGLFS